MYPSAAIATVVLLLVASLALGENATPPPPIWPGQFSCVRASIPPKNMHMHVLSFL